jgi:predicted PurR-regulated permease PerM
MPIVFLRWAQDVLIPITFAVPLSHALTLVVDWLKRQAKLHKAIGAALTYADLGSLGIGLIHCNPRRSTS